MSEYLVFTLALLVFVWVNVLVYPLISELGFLDPHFANLKSLALSKYGETEGFAPTSEGTGLFSFEENRDCLIFSAFHFAWLVRLPLGGWVVVYSSLPDVSSISLTGSNLQCHEFSSPPVTNLTELLRSREIGVSRSGDLSVYLFRKSMMQQSPEWRPLVERAVTATFIAKLGVCVLVFPRNDLTLFITRSGWTRVKEGDFFSDFARFPVSVRDSASCRLAGKQTHPGSLAALLLRVRESVRVRFDGVASEFEQKVGENTLTFTQELMPNLLVYMQATEALLVCGGRTFDATRVVRRLGDIPLNSRKLVNRMTAGVTDLFAPAMCAKALAARGLVAPGATLVSSAWPDSGQVWVRIMT